MDSSCSGQPIHLWQFLKELLLKPHSYGRFIRWLNKEKGEQCQGQEGRGLLGACGPARRWAGRAGGRAEGWSAPTFALNATHALLLDRPRVCVPSVSTRVPRLGSAC